MLECKHCFGSQRDGEDLCGHCTIWCDACHSPKEKEPASSVGEAWFCVDCVRETQKNAFDRSGFQISEEGAVYSLALRNLRASLAETVRPDLTGNDLTAIGHAVPCIRCREKPALSGKGMNHCEECNEALWPSKYRRDPDAYEQAMSDYMEGSGDSLEPSVRSAGGGMHRWWPGAHFTDYDRGDE